MQTLAKIATVLIGVLHLYILVPEIFLWTTPRGMRAFGLTPEFA